MLVPHCFVYFCAVALLCPAISSACNVGNPNIETRSYSTLHGATITIPCNIKVDLLSHLQFDANGFSKLYIKVDSCSIFTTANSFYIKVKKENGKVSFTDYVYDSSATNVLPEVYSNLSLISSDSCDLRFTNIDILKFGEKLIPEIQLCPFSSFVFFYEISNDQPCSLADRIVLKVQGLPVDPPSNLSVITSYGVLSENSRNFLYAGDFIICYFNSTKDSVFPKNIDGSNMTYAWTLDGVLQNENSYPYKLLIYFGTYQCTATYTSYDNQYSWNIQSKKVEVTEIYGPINGRITPKQIAKEGDVATVECFFESSPPADFSLSTKGFEKINSSLIKWVIEDINTNMSDIEIICKAFNVKSHKSESISTTIEVQCAGPNIETRSYSTLFGATITIPCYIKVDLLSHLQFDANGFSKLYIKVDSCSIFTTANSFYIKVKKENGKIEFTDYVYDSSTPTVHPQIFGNLSLISNDSCDLRFTNIDILKFGEKLIPEIQLCPFSSFVFFTEIGNGKACPIADKVNLIVQNVPVHPPDHLYIKYSGRTLAALYDNIVYPGAFITCYFNSTKDNVFPKTIDGTNMTYFWSVNGVLQNESSYQYQVLNSNGMYQCAAVYLSYDFYYSWKAQTFPVKISVMHMPSSTEQGIWKPPDMPSSTEQRIWKPPAPATGTSLQTMNSFFYCLMTSAFYIVLLK